jgi:hypothetical protein
VKDGEKTPTQLGPLDTLNFSRGNFRIKSRLKININFALVIQVRHVFPDLDIITL